MSIIRIKWQVEIVDKIIAKGGDYMLALKANQSSLLSDVESMFNAKNTYNPAVFEEYGKGHGRIEIRKCDLIQNPKWLQEQHKNWRNLNSVAKITSTRIIKEKETTAMRYYIFSHQDNARITLERSRQHWTIENNLHWILDVQFR